MPSTNGHGDAQGEHLNLRAADIWTGDVLLPGDKIVTRLERSGDRLQMTVTVADIVPSNGVNIPIEVINELDVTMSIHEHISVIRGRPLVNGMHMTQFDVDGMCYGGAHPELEAKLRREGKMAR